MEGVGTNYPLHLTIAIVRGTIESEGSTTMIAAAEAPRPIPSEGLTYKFPLTWEFIFQSDIPPGPRILYAYIVSRSDRDDTDLGVGIPMEVLGRTLNVSYATVWKWIQRLQQMAFLRVEQNSAGHNRYFPHHYWFM